ncbi:DUF5995 family protein [Croceivirga sp. JEA036]|uniref:DUF5995 family protein n=1 Tax=Croceivirga sp. JEA036 TaxID=2721162 RepID=UPI001438FB34|nr:DUF5995 family protein [Croceivirga sp. JEA036]NJB34976.1 hypothetical protein [Croceivirga sp. JEA036]
MQKATTIQQVLQQLDAIIAESIQENNSIGLFAYVYRRTTAEIAKELALGNFENGQRLERMDVAFANLYLDAYKAYKNGLAVSKAWAIAFSNAAQPLTVLQHIMLGMNAHINLDLAIATATSMENQDIKAIENDFNKVNDILFQITDELQDRLGRVSPLLFVLDLLGRNNDEKIIDFSMRKARQQAWNAANLLWSLGPEDNQQAIKNLDILIERLGAKLANPPSFLVKYALKLIQKFEKDEVGVIITKLSADQ